VKLNGPPGLKPEVAMTKVPEKGYNDNEDVEDLEAKPEVAGIQLGQNL
jgi:hypothetical protein